MDMHFIDANVFIHALLKPRKNQTSEAAEIKHCAQAILFRIENGEAGLTSTVHLSEVANVLEDYMPAEEALSRIVAVLSNKNIEIAPVFREDYVAATALARDIGIGINDALAVLLMKKRNLNQIYSFDKGLEKVAGINKMSK